MTTSTTFSLSTSDVSPRPLTHDFPNLAFIGPMGSGKSTLANSLCARLPYRRLSFAAALKGVSTHIWGYDRGMERDKLQRLGVAVREIDPDAWANLLRTDLETDFPPAVIDDCRFPNEYQMLRGYGFVFVRVKASAEKRLDRLAMNGRLQDPEQLLHESEQHQVGFACDYEIDNSFSVYEAEMTLADILNKERKRR